METKSMSLSTTVHLPVKPKRLRQINDPVILLAALLCLLCSSILVLAQATSSDYTNDLPSVERVKAEIKGSDPTDTLARQVAVFTYLQAYIDRIKSNRSVRGTFTPRETKLWDAYRKAAAWKTPQDT